MKCWVLKMNFQNLFPWQHTKGKCDYIFILISLIWVNQPLKLTILRGIYSFPLSCSCQITWAELSESVSGKKKSDQSIPCRGWNPNQKPTLQVSTIWHYISTILTTELLFALFDFQPCSNECQHPYRTLWGRAPFLEILPCWWPCKCRYPRRPVGCCGWLACCAHLPACWKCTAPMAPAAALSFTSIKQKHTTQMSDGRKNMATNSHLTVTSVPQHCSTFDVTDA